MLNTKLEITKAANRDKKNMTDKKLLSVTPAKELCEIRKK